METIYIYINKSIKSRMGLHGTFKVNTEAYCRLDLECVDDTLITCASVTTQRLDSRSNKHIANSSGPMAAADSLDDGAVCLAAL